MGKKKMEINIPSMDSLSTAQRAVSSILNSNLFEYLYVNLDNIRLNPENSEFNQEDTQDEIIVLADSIEKNGMLHNIVLSEKENGDYLMLSGERRYKAHKYLLDTGKSDYSKIYAQIRKGLSKTEESIILLTANVNARGGGSTDEIKRRRSANKLVSLIEEQYGVSTKEAMAIVTKQTNIDKQTLNINLDIERNLIPELKNLFNNGVFNKDKAKEYVSLPEDVQKIIYSAITMTIEEAEKNPDNSLFSNAFKDLNEKIQEGSKKIKEYESLLNKRNEILNKKNEELESLKEQNKIAIEELEQKLENMESNDDDDNDENNKEIIRLREELSNMKESFEKKEKNLAGKIKKLTEENKNKEVQIKEIKSKLTEDLHKKPEVNIEVTAQLKKEILRKIVRIEDLVDEFFEVKNIENINSLNDVEINNKLQLLNEKITKLNNIV